MTVPLRVPFAAGHGTVTDRELLLVSLRGRRRPHGLRRGGAAAVLRRRLAGGGPRRAAGVRAGPGGLSRRRADRRRPRALCARRRSSPRRSPPIDLALWDLAGRRTREPVWRLLGAARPAPVAVNWTITPPTGRAPPTRRPPHGPRATAPSRSRWPSATTPGGSPRSARSAVRTWRSASTPTAPGQSDEAATLRALRHGHRAVRGARVAAWPRSGCWAPGQLDYALALDESAADPDALLPATRPTSCCLKISRCGGIAA